MKNILARGGIEFLAVLLGISGSLWIDSNNKSLELKSKTAEVYSLLENQADELINYTTNKLNEYDKQLVRYNALINDWDTFNSDTIVNKKKYISDIWFSIQNGYYPDFSIYETLINSGEINLVDFKTIRSFGRLYESMEDIYNVQKKEREWRDFIENYLMNNYSTLFIEYSLPYDLFEFFKLTKNDNIIFAHLKSIGSLHSTRKIRVAFIRDTLNEIKDNLLELKGNK
jgi:hypothetical protein